MALQAPDCDYAFVMNFTEENQTVEFPEGIRDLLTGEELQGEVELGCYEVRVVEKQRSGKENKSK